MENLSYEQFESAVDDAGPFSHEALIDAVDRADLINFSKDELKLAAEVLVHVCKA